MDEQDHNDQQDEVTTVTTAPYDYKGAVNMKNLYEKKCNELQSQLSVEQKKRTDLHKQIIDLKEEVKQNTKMIDL